MSEISTNGEWRGRSRPIFVLGVDRSGTSLVSEITYNWGAYPGKMDLLASGNEGNPRGYWEYEPMEEFLNQLFDSVGVSHWDPSFSEKVGQRAKDGETRRKALELVAEMEQAPAWFWKEPYLCLCISFWEQILVDPIYVIPVRHPFESAMSYEKFMLPPTLRGSVRLIALFLMRWQHFAVNILRHSQPNPNKIFIHYEKLLQHPQEQCERLCRFLDRQCGIDGTEEDRRERVRKMSRVVNPDLWRNRATVDLSEVPESTPTQRDLYQLLLAKVEDPGVEAEADRYPVAGWWREYMENLDLMLGLFNIE